MSESKSVSAGTRRETGGGVLGTRREGLAGGGYVRVNLPPELVAVFDVEGEIGSGGESDVLLVHRRGDGARRAALKIYRHGLEPDAAALAAIRELPREHVVEIWDCGPSTAGWWEEQEYIEHGSLADLVVAEGPKLSSVRLTEVLVELTSALEAVHPILHRDVKPTNVLVRTVDPLDLVLGDFGLARSTEFSHIVSRVAGSLAYQSPEALDGAASPARDWWALGMIVAEAAIGRHPFFDPELGWPSVAEMRIALTTRPVPLDGIEDERVRLLCRGLLVRDPRHRWGAQEVRTWLDGGSPPVADAPTGNPRHGDPGIPPFVFAGERCLTPEQLAPALAQHWDDALRLIGGAASEAPDYIRLAGWLQDHEHQAALRVLNAALDRSIARRLFRLLRALAPALPPSFHGYLLDLNGLTDIARDAAGADANAATILYDILHLDILGELAREDAYQELATVVEAWRKQIEQFREIRDGLGTRGAALTGTEAEMSATASMLHVLLTPDALSQLQQSASTAVAAADVPSSDPRSEYLRELMADEREPSRLLATIAVAAVIGDEVAIEAEQRRQEEEARESERRAREKAKRTERRAKAQAEKALRRAEAEAERLSAERSALLEAEIRALEKNGYRLLMRGPDSALFERPGFSPFKRPLLVDAHKLLARSKP